MEPVAGLEPATDGLQNRCSTTELNWLKVVTYPLQTQRNLFWQSPSQWQVDSPLTRNACVERGQGEAVGFPPRLPAAGHQQRRIGQGRSHHLDFQEGDRGRCRQSAAHQAV